MWSLPNCWVVDVFVSIIVVVDLVVDLVVDIAVAVAAVVVVDVDAALVVVFAAIQQHKIFI